MQQPVSLQDTLARMLGNELAYMNNLELGAIEQEVTRRALQFNDGNAGASSGEFRTAGELDAAVDSLTSYYSQIVAINRSSDYVGDGDANYDPQQGYIRSNSTGADMYVASRVGGGYTLFVDGTAFTSGNNGEDTDDLIADLEAIVGVAKEYTWLPHDPVFVEKMNASEVVRLRPV